MPISWMARHKSSQVILFLTLVLLYAAFPIAGKSDLFDGLVSLLEPIMVVALGGIVGFIVIALFLPLVALISTVSQ